MEKIFISFERLEIGPALAFLGLNESFKFQPNVCNRCHDLLMSMKLSDIAILNIKGSDYCCIIGGISKTEAINLMQNTNLTEKSRTLFKKKNIFIITYKNR